MKYANKRVKIESKEHLDHVIEVTGMVIGCDDARDSMIEKIGQNLHVCFDDGFDDDRLYWGYDYNSLTYHTEQIEEIFIPLPNPFLKDGYFNQRSYRAMNTLEEIMTNTKQASVKISEILHGCSIENDTIFKLTRLIDAEKHKTLNNFEALILEAGDFERLAIESVKDLKSRYDGTQHALVEWDGVEPLRVGHVVDRGEVVAVEGGQVCASKNSRLDLYLLEDVSPVKSEAEQLVEEYMKMHTSFHMSSYTEWLLNRERSKV